MTSPGHKITIDLSPHDADLLDAICAREDIRPTEAIRRALRHVDGPGAMRQLGDGLRALGVEEGRE